MGFYSLSWWCVPQLAVLHDQVQFSHRGAGQASMLKALALAESKVLADDLARDG